ncbi:MAG TPA: PEP-CTERM sorting domain-containing protein [Stellaceae bacterium]|nr:PEP-CTERM sorting domain-containing protein [Stellaceae bacterium]
MKRLVAAAAIAGALLYGGQAQAGPITGTLSLTGTDSFTASSINFTGAGSIGADSGSFLELGTCTGCVALNNFTASATNFQVYSATNNLDTTALTLANVVFDYATGATFDTLTISGSGTATLTGFDPTPGTFKLTTQGTSGQTDTGIFTFSSTTVATAVPEPASLTLLASALGTLAWFSRRRKQV